MKDKDYKSRGSKNNARGAKSRSKSNSRGKATCDRDDFDRGMRDPGHNDVTWYAASPQLLKDTGTLNFSQVLGRSENIFQRDTEAFPLYDDIPGIMTFEFVPTIGYSVGLQDAANLAAIQIFSTVRKANSGAANYQAPDLMMYLMAVDSVYMYITHLMRIYAVARTYNAYNRYYPIAVIKSLGVDDPMQIITDMARFRSVINTLVLGVSQLAAPSNMPLFARHSWLCANIFLDEDNKKAQSYAFVPTIFYKFDATSETGTALRALKVKDGEFQGIRDSGNFIDDAYAFGRMLIDVLVYDTDVAIMCGDIRKAYDNLYHISEIAENASLIPVYNAEVNAQIHNMTFCGEIEQPKRWDITQDPTNSAIIQKPYLPGIMPAKRKWVLDSNSDTPSPEEVVIATRLSAVPIASEELPWASDDTDTQCLIYTCGSEVVTQATVWGLQQDGTPVARFSMSGELTYVTNSSPGQIEVLASNASALSKFNHAPFYYVFRNDNTGRREGHVIGSRANFTYYEADVVNRIHAMAMLSLFDVKV